MAVSKEWQLVLDMFQKRESAAARAARQITAELGYPKPEAEQFVHRFFRDYVAALSRYWKARGFPYFHKEISIARKAKEFDDLIRRHDQSNQIKNGVVVQNMDGLGLANSYFPHMWSVPVRESRTPLDVFNDDTLLAKAIMKRVKWGGISKKSKSKLTPNEIRKAVRTFTGTQGVSNFRPSAAGSLYHKYLPEKERWGCV